MNKTEWLSLNLHSENILALVNALKVQDGSEYLSLLALQSALTSMRTMTSLRLGLICSSPEEIRNLEVSI